MKTILVTLVFSFSILLVACSKDKFQSKPLIEIKEYSSKDISKDGVLTIKLNYFDKEGDLSSAPFFAEIIRMNILPIGPLQNLTDSFFYNLPEFPERDNGEIFFKLAYDRLKESTIENDTLTFRFAVTDLAGNKSDTITSEKVVIHLP